MSIDLPINPEVVYFATTNYRQQKKVFGIQRKDRRQHMYILGKSGMGKSTLISNMVFQDMRNGDGLAVIDPHGDLVEHILTLVPRSRLRDIVYFDPSEDNWHIGFNILESKNERQRSLMTSSIMGIFTKIWSNVWSARMEYILTNSILALSETPNTTLLALPKLLTDKNYRSMIVGNIKDPVIKNFWINEYETWDDRYRKEAIAPIQNKVGQFLANKSIRNILGQSKSTINLLDIMDRKKIFLVNLSKGKIGEDSSALLGAMIVTKLQLAAMERVSQAEDDRKDFFLYVDEFQNFVNDSFANILSEARKYRLNLILAHQYIGQLESPANTKVRDAVFGNVGTLIIGRLGSPDAKFLEKEFSPDLEPEDFVALPNYNVYLKLLVNGVTTKPFSATTLPPIKIENVASQDLVNQAIKLSHYLYHKKSTEVEAEILAWSQQSDNLPKKNSEPPRNISTKIEDRRQADFEQIKQSASSLANIGLEFSSYNKNTETKTSIPSRFLQQKPIHSEKEEVFSASQTPEESRFGFLKTTPKPINIANSINEALVLAIKERKNHLMKPIYNQKPISQKSEFTKKPSDFISLRSLEGQNNNEVSPTTKNLGPTTKVRSKTFSNQNKDKQATEEKVNDLKAVIKKAYQSNQPESKHNKQALSIAKPVIEEESFITSNNRQPNRNVQGPSTSLLKKILEDEVEF